MDALQFLIDRLRHQLSETSGEVWSSSFLFQGISVAVQLVHNSFVDGDRPEYEICVYLWLLTPSPCRRRSSDARTRVIISYYGEDR